MLTRKPMKRTYRNTGPSDDTVTRLLERSGHMCEACDLGIGGPRGLRWQVHHRRPRAMGGTRWEGINEPSNLLILCSSCHADVESRRQHARDTTGRLVPNGTDPATVPVLIGAHWHLLTNDFGFERPGGVA